MTTLFGLNFNLYYMFEYYLATNQDFANGCNSISSFTAHIVSRNPWIEKLIF